MSSIVPGSQKMFRAEPRTEARSTTYTRNGDINRRRLMHRAKNKSLRISVVIVMAFLIWWTPYYTMMIIFLFLNPDKHVSIFIEREIKLEFCSMQLDNDNDNINKRAMLLAQRGVTERNIFLRHEQ